MTKPVVHCLEVVEVDQQNSGCASSPCSSLQCVFDTITEQDAIRQIRQWIMEGLVSEALKHTIEEGPATGPVLDAAIIAQYQRMTHYGITGFGTVAAFAKALKLDDDNKQLRAAVKDMYAADELMTELAEAAINVDAVDE